MKLLLDMNLSPVWARFLEEHDFEARHWSAHGVPTATDAEVMAWARENGFVLVTHDLGFAGLLAATEARGPSIVLIRAQEILPDRFGPVLLRVLRDHETTLADGAVLSIDEFASRLRVLPIRRP